MGIESFKVPTGEENFLRQKEAERDITQEAYNGFSDKEKRCVDMMRDLLDFKREVGEKADSELRNLVNGKIERLESHLNDMVYSADEVSEEFKHYTLNRIALALNQTK